MLISIYMFFDTCSSAFKHCLHYVIVCVLPGSVKCHDTIPRLKAIIVSAGLQLVTNVALRETYVPHLK